jgi:hypothetical protein
MTQCRKKQVNCFCVKIGVADLHHFNADADPVSAFPLMMIRIPFQLFILLRMRSRTGSGSCSLL